VVNKIFLIDTIKTNRADEFWIWGFSFIVVGLSLRMSLPVIRWLRRWSNISSIVGGIPLIVVGILMLTNSLSYLA
jgi:putative Mn2+ efflux pump MntP